MRVLITGAAGYVGYVLIKALESIEGIDEIIGVDLQPKPGELAASRKVAWIQADVSTDDWQAAARNRPVDAVVHLAFQIRQLYGRQKDTQRCWNIGGARKVFAFAFGEAPVRRLIHFSTVTAYGAREDNSLAVRFSEKAQLNERDYLYGSHKREVEQLLQDAYAASDRRTYVTVLRCASISGPYGRSLGRFGIVSTLAGKLPLLPRGRADFGRQYLHEDDIAEIVTLLLTAPSRGGYEVFNAAPEDYLASADLAALLRKHTITFPPALLRGLFALCWRISRGRIPTPRGAWKFLTYPIVVDGSALTKTYNYRYHFTSADALMARAGRHSAITAAPTVERHGREPNAENIRQDHPAHAPHSCLGAPSWSRSGDSPQAVRACPRPDVP